MSVLFGIGASFVIVLSSFLLTGISAIVTFKLYRRMKRYIEWLGAIAHIATDEHYSRDTVRQCAVEALQGHECPITVPVSAPTS